MIDQAKDANTNSSMKTNNVRIKSIEIPADALGNREGAKLRFPPGVAAMRRRGAIVLCARHSIHGFPQPG